MGAPDSGIDTRHVVRMLRGVMVWSAVLAAVVAAAGWAITRDVRFASGCALGAVTDAGTLGLIARAARRGFAFDRARVAGVLAAYLWRLVADAAALVAAFALPAWFSLLGALAGVLCVEVALLAGGSIDAVLATYGDRRTPGGLAGGAGGAR